MARARDAVCSDGNVGQIGPYNPFEGMGDNKLRLIEGDRSEDRFHKDESHKDKGYADAGNDNSAYAVDEATYVGAADEAVDDDADYTGYNNAEEASLGGTAGYNRNVDEDNVTKHADVDVAYDAADEYDDVDEGKDVHVLDDDYWWWDCYLQDSIDYGEAPRLKEKGNDAGIMITIPIGGWYVIAATLLRSQDQRWLSECIRQDIDNVTEVERYDLA